MSINLKRYPQNLPKAPLITEEFDKEQKVKVLEFGPGLGICTDILHETYKDIDYSIIDLDDDILKGIKGKYKDLKTYNIETYLKLKNTITETYDIVIALDVWEHLPKEQLQEYTNFVIEHLNPNGLFIAQVPNWGCPFAPNTIYANDLTHNNFFNEISAAQLISNTAIKGISFEILPYLFPNDNLLWKIRNITRKFMFLLYKFNLFLLGLQRLDIVTPNLIIKVKKDGIS